MSAREITLSCLYFFWDRTLVSLSNSYSPCTKKNSYSSILNKALHHDPRIELIFTFALLSDTEKFQCSPLICLLKELQVLSLSIYIDHARSHTEQYDR